MSDLESRPFYATSPQFMNSSEEELSKLFERLSDIDVGLFLFVGEILKTNCSWGEERFPKHRSFWGGHEVWIL
jgi:hypothetical protein